MRKVPPNGTLSADERKREIFLSFSAVRRRVRYKNEVGRYALKCKTAPSKHFADLFKTRRFSFMQNEGRKGFWRNLFFSKTLQDKNQSHKIAYIAVMTAFIIVSNFFEFKLRDTQFSLTIVVALLSGIIIGSVFGFAACMLGDFIGFLLHPAYIYMPWVGISTGLFAFLAGLIVNGIPVSFKGGIWVKLALVSLLSFFVCTVGVNSAGFYFYNKAMGFSTAVIDYVSERFGGGVTFLAYVFYRLFFKGQIWNSLFNYVLLFLAVPMLNKIKPLKMQIR